VLGLVVGVLSWQDPKPVYHCLCAPLLAL
jgi:hypothetical protein